MTAWRDTKKLHKGLPDLTEHEIQSGIFAELAQYHGKIAGLEWVHSIPNGAKLPYTKGKDNRRICNQAVWLKNEGMTPGISDIFGPAPRGGYHGIYVEVKSRIGKASEEQKAFMEYAAGEGFYVCLVRTINEGVGQILGYYQGLITKPEEE
jgi:hypothetical protein